MYLMGMSELSEVFAHDQVHKYTDKNKLSVLNSALIVYS